MPEFLFRVIREKVAGETLSIHLEVIKDNDLVDLTGTGEFTTGSLPYDPWGLDPTDWIKNPEEDK